MPVRVVESSAPAQVSGSSLLHHAVQFLPIPILPFYYLMIHVVGWIILQLVFLQFLIAAIDLRADAVLILKRSKLCKIWVTYAVVMQRIDLNGRMNSC